MLARLKRRLPDASDEALLADLLSEAAAFIRAYTRREVVPDELEDAVVRIAAILYNRMGMEGESTRTEGGVTHTADALPEDLRSWLNSWRLASTAG